MHTFTQKNEVKSVVKGFKNGKTGVKPPWSRGTTPPLAFQWRWRERQNKASLSPPTPLPSSPFPSLHPSLSLPPSIYLLSPVDPRRKKKKKKRKKLGGRCCRANLALKCLPRLPRLTRNTVKPHQISLFAPGASWAPQLCPPPLYLWC